MFDLKADPKVPHHYIIGIAVHGMRSDDETRGKMFLKYGPVYFHHKDIENVQNAAMMSVDKVFKTSSKEAAEMYDCTQIIGSLTGMKIAAASNEATLHHFSSEFEIPDADEWFEGYVNNANSCEDIRRQINESRIKGY